MGTGTTGIAALMHDRKFYGCELDANYFEAACNRIKQEDAQERLFA